MKTKFTTILLALLLGIVGANAQNLLTTNPGFEDGISSWMTDYAKTAEIIDEGHSGSNSLLLKEDLYYLMYDYDFTNFFDKTFTLSFWYKTVEGDVSISPALHAYKEDFSDSFWVGGESNPITLTASNDDWTYYTYTYTQVNTNKDLSPFTLFVFYFSSSQQILIDDVSLTVKSSSEVSVTGVSLNKNTTSLTVGATEQLTATIAPANATNNSVLWSSSNEAVATVSSTGLVSAVAAGETTITVTSKDGNFTATCNVTVNAVSTQNLLTTNPGFEDGISAWTTDYTNTAEIIDEGHSGNNSLLYSGQLYYDLTNYDFTNFFDTTFTLSFWYKTTEDETEIAMVLEAYDADYSNPLLVGGNPSYVSVVSSDQWQYYTLTLQQLNQNKDLSSYFVLSLNVTANKKILIDDVSLTVKSSSEVAVTGVALNKNTTSLNVGATEQLTATIAPADATNDSVLWSSSNEAVAKVDSGLVTALAAGTTTITVTSKDGNFTATCEVTVNAVSATSELSANTFSVYPNPVTSDIITLSVNNTEGGVVSIYNLAGKMVLQQSLSFTNDKAEINVSNLSKGVYMMRFAGNVVKLVK